MFLDLISERFNEEANVDEFHNFVFFELELNDNYDYKPLNIFKAAYLNQELSRLNQSSFSGTGGILRSIPFTVMDLTILVNKDKMEPFEWDI
jgi:hypothetical protein